MARFFLYGVLLLSILCGFGFSKVLETGGKRVIVLGVAVLLVMLSISGAVRSRKGVKTWQVEENLTRGFQWLAQDAQPERVYSIGLDFWDSYLLPTYANRQLIDGWLHESAPNWREITQLDDMEWGFRPVDLETYYSILKKYDAKYVILGNQLGSTYVPEYHFGMYEEYARLLSGSSHFRQVATFGDVKIFEVL